MVEEQKVWHKCNLPIIRWKYYFIASRFASDNEEDRVSQNGRPAKSEFKDEEETVTTKSVTQATETTTTTTRKRGGVPSKTVDLGAAAHYTGDKNNPDADNAKVTSICLIPPLLKFLMAIKPE